MMTFYYLYLSTLPSLIKISRDEQVAMANFNANHKKSNFNDAFLLYFYVDCCGRWLSLIN